MSYKTNDYSKYCDSTCNYCIDCDYCINCNGSKYCDTCINCNGSKCCNYCTNCINCDSCKYCNGCRYSKNLKMCNHQLFCYAEELGEEHPNSYQQNSYRVFNTQVTKEEFEKIKVPKIKLEFDSDGSFQTAWENLTKEEKQEFFDIPCFNSEIFAKITGVGLDELPVQKDDIYIKKLKELELMLANSPLTAEEKFNILQEIENLKSKIKNQTYGELN